MPTDKEKVIRKLKAILSADVKGYSLLMADDEAFTIQTLKEYRDIMSTYIGQHNGRVVDAPGDNLLAEFSSAVDAVQCAVEIQEILKDKNDNLPNGKRLEFRIGVNIGDVVQDGDRIYGSGVNVAARIEGLSDPGGVCISRNTYGHIKDKLKLGYEYLGQHKVKNIKDPVRVYKVLLDPEDTGKLIGEKPERAKKKWVLPVVIVTAVIMTSIFWYFYQSTMKPGIEPASLENMALQLPDLPSIAVLPFDNMSGDPKQEFLGDGITENIITALSKVPRLFVIARNSTSTYKGKPVKVKQVSEELGVQYVLEGSVQRSADRIRITAQLIDALKGHHLWAERYDRNLTEIFALQDEITLKILKAIQVKLTEGETYSTVPYAGGKQDLDCYLKAMEALGHVQRANIEDTNVARRIAEEAIATCPEPLKPYSLMAAIHMMDYWFGTGKSPRESIEKAIELAQKSLAVDDSRAESHALLGYLYSLRKEWDKAIAEGERSIALNPSGADVKYWYAATLTFAGRPEEAILLFEKAIRLNPFGPSRYFLSYGHALLYVGRFKEAVSAYKKALQREPNNFFAHLRLAATYSMMGLEKEAQAEASEVLRLNPKFSLDNFAKILGYKDRTETEKIITALRKSGLPDQPPLPLPDKPSIAVLAFDNLSGDPEQEYFSDGISEDIITALSKTPKIFVIARNSSFTYKGKPVKVQQVGRDLGVRYVLEGSARKAGEKVRITAQLIDAKTGHHIWADNYDRDLIDLFAVQDELTKNIISAMQVKLTLGEQARVDAQGTNNLQAYLKFLQARENVNRFNSEGNALGKRLAQEAIDLDPQYAMAYRILAATHRMDVFLGTSKSPKESISMCFKLLNKSLELDETYAEAYGALGFTYSMVGKHDQAVATAQKAVALDPNSANTYAMLGHTLRMADRPEEAIPAYKKAIRLNPIPPTFYLFGLGMSYSLAGQHEKGIEWCKKAVQQAPDDYIARIFLTTAYSMGGQLEDARAEVPEVLRINPKFSLAKAEKRANYKFKDKMFDALRKVGLPE